MTSSVECEKMSLYTLKPYLFCFSVTYYLHFCTGTVSECKRVTCECRTSPKSAYFLSKRTWLASLFSSCINFILVIFSYWSSVIYYSLFIFLVGYQCKRNSLFAISSLRDEKYTNLKIYCFKLALVSLLACNARLFFHSS